MNHIKAREYFDRYTYNIGFEHGTISLHQAYNKYSDKKHAAWKEIQDECTAFEGHHLSVITHCRQSFTAGYWFIKNKEYYFRVHTPSSSGVLHLGPGDILELKKQGMLYERD